MVLASVDRPAGACCCLAMAPTVLELLESSESRIHTSDGWVTSRTLGEEGRWLARAWTADGLAPGDRVAVYADNGLPYLRCVAAAAAGCFVVVSVNRRYAPEEARSLVERSGASLVITDAAPGVFDSVVSSDRVRDIGTIIAPAGIAPGGIASAGIAPAEAVVLSDATAVEPSADDPFIVFTTSGTTSRPKMVLHTQRSIAVHAREAGDRFGYTSDDRVLVALPLCGVFGFDGLTAALAADSTVWLPDRFESRAVADLVASEQITAMNGSDDMFHRMLDTTADLSSIRVGGYGRFNTSLDGIVERAAERGVTLTGLYGMSEVQALFALRDPGEDVAGRERAGGSLSSPSAAFRIVDPETSKPLPEGSDGELQLAGPSLFAGYLAEGGEQLDGDLTAAALVEAEGQVWFRTGDLARAEDDGTFTFLTRMGDVLRLGGFLVNPTEIEAIVNELPGISATVAVALPRHGGVRAAVAVIADHEPDPAVVIAHCSERLARFKVPVAVVRVDTFPTTPSANGTKIRVAELRAIVDEALAAGSS